MKQLTDKELETFSEVHRYISAGTYTYSVLCSSCNRRTEGQCLACNSRGGHKSSCVFQKSIPVFAKILDAQEAELQPERDPSMEEEGWEQVNPETPSESF